MEQLLNLIAREFRSAMQRWPEHLNTMRRILVMQDSARDIIRLCIQFRARDDLNFSIDLGMVYSGSLASAVHQLEGQLESVWWRTFEDHQMELMSRREMEVVHELRRQGAPGHVIEYAMRTAQQRIEHNRRHHEFEPVQIEVRNMTATEVRARQQEAYTRAAAAMSGVFGSQPFGASSTTTQSGGGK